MRAIRLICAAVIVASIFGGLAHAEFPGWRSQRTQAPRPAKPLTPTLALTDAKAKVLSCPTTPSELDTWREELIAQLLEPTIVQSWGNPAGLKVLDADETADRARKVAGYIDDCAAKLSPGALARIGNLRDFVQAQRNALDSLHQFGHGPQYDDMLYLRRIRYLVEPPCLLKSQEFLKAISKPQGYVEAELLIQRRNKGEVVAGCVMDPSEGVEWKTLLYKSATLGTPDDADAFGRYLVRVEGPTHDRWIQFGVLAPGEESNGYPIQNLSVVAAYKGTQPTSSPFSALVDWYRITNRDPTGQAIDLELRRKAVGATGACQQCHKTAVIGIHPKAEYRFDAASRSFLPDDKNTGSAILNEEIKLRYHGTGKSVGAGDEFARAEAYGPQLGPDYGDSQYRVINKSDLLTRCTGQPPGVEKPLRRTLISEKMNCAACHNQNEAGLRVGMLNFPIATQTTLDTTFEVKQVKDDATGYEYTTAIRPNMLYSFITRGIMPHYREGDTRLTQQEWPVLYRCLSMEYLDVESRTGLFVDWLRNEPIVPKPKILPDEAFQQLQAALSPSVNKVLSHTTALKPNVVGARDFKTYCQGCHSIFRDEAVVGPSLFGILQRTAGTARMRRADGSSLPFPYSQAFREALAAKGPWQWNGSELMQIQVDHAAYLGAKLGRVMSRRDGDPQVLDTSVQRRITEYLMSLK